MSGSGAVLAVMAGATSVAVAGWLLSPARRRPYLAGGVAAYSGRGDPLSWALRYGAAGLAIPVWPDASGELQVGVADPRPAGRPGATGRAGGRTLRRTVLDPLGRRVAAGQGSVYRGTPAPFDLIVELPGDETVPGLALRAYQRLDACLRDHAAMLTRWSADGGAVPGPVTVTITGRLSPRALLAASPQRYACVEGTFDDLGGAGAPPELAPLVSEHWSWRFGWDGYGPMPPEERHLLHSLVRAAHADARRVRFFGIPDRPGRVRAAMWAELSAAGVDLIGTHRLRALRRHLSRHRPPAPAPVPPPWIPTPTPGTATATVPQTPPAARTATVPQVAHGSAVTQGVRSSQGVRASQGSQVAQFRPVTSAASAAPPEPASQLPRATVAVKARPDGEDDPVNGSPEGARTLMVRRAIPPQSVTGGGAGPG